MNIHVPFDDAYIKLVGTAVYCFFYYEWIIVWVIEQLDPGFVNEYCRGRPRGFTSGLVSNRFRHAVECYDSGKGVEKTELECAVQTFHNLVQKRNALIHAHPITGDGGDQILNYQTSPTRKISDLKWDDATLQGFICEVNTAVCQIGAIHDRLLSG